ncbi:hypothetical protein E6C76_14965 [Pseudothauera nasutitermitis]|uniref:Uncharacterized protein n=1 Tax=Pseudothauera nasutitermitis TaxID=2565930 RepID=A0A4S4AV38_9RHOO|nr:hypothetical protein [Pseudothauera nasutitermitis]THF63877.1 hypothetical protein E6C76_14965 [Pseudothauera nasutitermitis]
MAEPSADPQARFLDRIDRRVRYLKSLQSAGLGVYLPADERQRTQAIEMVVRLTARQSELSHLTADTLRIATERVREHLEAMQAVLPHDVQYRNRIKRNW